MPKHKEMSALELRLSMERLNDLIKKSSSAGLIHKLLHYKYAIFYERYLVSTLNTFLHNQKAHDSSSFQTEFNSRLSQPNEYNEYCKALVSIVMDGLQALSTFIKHDVLATTQTLYDFIKINSDELLNIETIAYIINRAEGGIKAYTSSAFMQGHDINVVKKLSSSVGDTISAYKYNDHWHLTFRDEDKICVVDPNSQQESAFIMHHPEKSIIYLQLNIKQSAVGAYSSTCGKICIALKTVFPQLFSNPNTDTVISHITSLTLQAWKAKQFEEGLSGEVLKLLEEDNSYYFNTLKLLERQLPDYDVKRAIQQIISIQCKEYNDFVLLNESFQGNIKCDTLQIFLSPFKITGNVMARKILVDEELVTTGLSMINSSKGILLVDDVLIMISNLLLEMIGPTELVSTVSLLEIIGNTALGNSTCFLEIIGDVELGDTADIF